MQNANFMINIYIVCRRLHFGIKDDVQFDMKQKNGGNVSELEMKGAVTVLVKKVQIYCNFHAENVY